MMDVCHGASTNPPGIIAGVRTRMRMKLKLGEARSTSPYLCLVVCKVSLDLIRLRYLNIDTSFIMDFLADCA